MLSRPLSSFTSFLLSIACMVKRTRLLRLDKPQRVLPCYIIFWLLDLPLGHPSNMNTVLPGVCATLMVSKQNSFCKCLTMPQTHRHCSVCKRSSPGLSTLPPRTSVLVVGQAGVGDNE